MTRTGTPVDDLGAPVRSAGPPARLVSLVPNLSELAACWGLADRVVGVTDHCVEPPGAYDRVPRVRGTKNPDVAAIVALQPDLVLASEEENRELDVQRLRGAGLDVHVTRVRSIAQLPGSLRRLGHSLGRPDEADALATQVAGLRQVTSSPSPRVVCAVWRDAPDRAGDDEGWWLLGRDTYGGSVIGAAGGKLVPVAPSGRYPRVPFGELLRSAPDLVLLPDEPYAFGPREVAELDGHHLRARTIDGKALWWWGTRTPSAIAEVAELLAHG